MNNAQNEIETMKIVCKFRSSCPEVLYQNNCYEKFGKCLGKHPWWIPILTKFRNQGL